MNTLTDDEVAALAWLRDELRFDYERRYLVTQSAYYKAETCFAAFDKLLGTNAITRASAQMEENGECEI